MNRTGVAIIINKDIKNTVLGYNTFNDRIMSVKLQATPVKINIVQVYTPTSTASEEEIDHFYEQLTEVVIEPFQLKNCCL